MFKWLKRALRRSPKKEEILLPDSWNFNERCWPTHTPQGYRPALSPRYKVPIEEAYYSSDEHDGIMDAMKDIYSKKHESKVHDL